MKAKENWDDLSGEEMNLANHIDEFLQDHTLNELMDVLKMAFRYHDDVIKIWSEEK